MRIGGFGPRERRCGLRTSQRSPDESNRKRAPFYGLNGAIVYGAARIAVHVKHRLAGLVLYSIPTRCLLTVTSA